MYSKGLQNGYRHADYWSWQVCLWLAQMKHTLKAMLMFTHFLFKPAITRDQWQLRSCLMTISHSPAIIKPNDSPSWRVSSTYAMSVCTGRPGWSRISTAPGVRNVTSDSATLTLQWQQPFLLSVQRRTMKCAGELKSERSDTVLWIRGWGCGDSNSVYSLNSKHDIILCLNASSCAGCSQKSTGHNFTKTIQSACMHR